MERINRKDAYRVDPAMGRVSFSLILVHLEQISPLTYESRA